MSWVFVHFDDVFILFRIFSLMKKLNTKMQFKNPVMWTFKVEPLSSSYWLSERKITLFCWQSEGYINKNVFQYPLFGLSFFSHS